MPLSKNNKICPQCQRTLPATKQYFHAQKNGKHGFTSRCKECKKQYVEENFEREAARKHEWYLRNKEEILAKAREDKDAINEQRRERRAKNPDKYRDREREYWVANADKKKQKGARYYRNNRDELLEKCAERYRANPDQVKERVKKWARENPEKYKQMNNQKWHRYRSKIKKAEYNYSKQDWKYCKEYFNNTCCYCGDKTSLTKEHLIPVEDGGGFVKDNILPACMPCNSSKRNRTLDDWYPEQQFYMKERHMRIIAYVEEMNCHAISKAVKR